MLQTNKHGNIVINSSNLEIMLHFYPQIDEDLVITNFRSTGRESITFRGDISSAAVSKLATALQEKGWPMPGAKSSVLYALQNAVFKLHHEGKLDVAYCDYFEGEPKAAREWEGNTVDYVVAEVPFNVPYVKRAAPVVTNGDELEKTTQQIIAEHMPPARKDVA